MRSTSRRTIAECASHPSGPSGIAYRTTLSMRGGVWSQVTWSYFTDDSMLRRVHHERVLALSGPPR
jgi:hypothetical protein